MVFWIIFSDLLSKALVASSLAGPFHMDMCWPGSKNKTEGFFSRARAMAMRCFWPPEN